MSLQQQGSSTQGIVREPKIGFPMKFDGARSQLALEQFRNGLRNDVKDLPLAFPEEPKLLTEAISRAV